MTKTITIITGSVRPNNVGEALLPHVQTLLAAKDVHVQVANLRELELPFFNGPVSPVDESYEITDEHVKVWQELIVKSDGVVFLTPEYNHAMSAVQKNAVDWLFQEWKDVPAATISYGWGGGALAAEALEKLLKKVEAAPLATATNLFFMKDITPSGEVIDESAVNGKLDATLEEVVTSVAA